MGNFPKAEVARWKAGACAPSAGIGVNTVSNLEAGRSVAFENVVRVAMVPGRRQELQELFKPRLDSLDDILRYENSASRQRIKKKSSHAQAS